MSRLRSARCASSASTTCWRRGNGRERARCRTVSCSRADAADRFRLQRLDPAAGIGHVGAVHGAQRNTHRLRDRGLGDSALAQQYHLNPLPVYAALLRGASGLPARTPGARSLAISRRVRASESRCLAAIGNGLPRPTSSGARASLLIGRNQNGPERPGNHRLSRHRFGEFAKRGRTRVVGHDLALEPSKLMAMLCPCSASAASVTSQTFLLKASTWGSKGFWLVFIRHSPLQPLQLDSSPIRSI